MTEFENSEDKRKILNLDIKSEFEVKDELVDFGDEREENDLTNYSLIRHNQVKSENNMKRFGSHEDSLTVSNINIKSESDVKDESFDADGEDRCCERDLNNEQQSQLNQLENRTIEFGSSEDKKNLDLAIKSEFEIKDELIESSDEFVSNEHGLRSDTSRTDNQPKIESDMKRCGSDGDCLPVLDQDIKCENDIKDEPDDAGDDLSDERNLSSESEGQDNQVCMNLSSCEERPSFIKDNAKRPPEMHLATYLKAQNGKRLNKGSIVEKNTGYKILDGDDIKFFKCSKCKFKTKHSGWLKRHLLLHNNRTKYRCRKCSYSTKNKCDLTNHLLNHADAKQLQCSECSFECTRLGQLESHLLMHSETKRHSESSLTTQNGAQLNEESIVEENTACKMLHGDDDKFLECLKCKFKTKHSGWFKRHLVRHNNRTKFRCRKCSYLTKNKCDFMNHLLNHAHTKLMQCSKCSYKCDGISQLKSHFLTHSEIKLFKCSECTYQCNYKNSLKAHVLKHSDVKLFKCAECNYECNIKSNLKIHLLNTHSNARMFKCSECDYKCKQKHTLQVHLLTHSNSKLLKCSECSYKSNHRYNLKIHMLSHSDVRLYKCSQCSYECNRKCNFKTHLLTHSKTKLLKCSKCDYETNYQNSLKLHSLDHSKVKLFKCPRCDYTTNRKDNFKTHKQRRHADYSNI